MGGWTGAEVCTTIIAMGTISLQQQQEERAHQSQVQGVNGTTSACLCGKHISHFFDWARGLRSYCLQFVREFWMDHHIFQQRGTCHDEKRSHSVTTFKFSFNRGPIMDAPHVCCEAERNSLARASAWFSRSQKSLTWSFTILFFGDSGKVNRGMAKCQSCWTESEGLLNSFTWRKHH